MNARRVALLFFVIGAVELIFIFRLLNQSSAPSHPSENKSAPETTSEKIKVQTLIRTNQFDWRSVESSDYRAYISNLRKIGCPEETVRDIIIADVDKLFAARLRAISSRASHDQKYWQPSRQEISEEAVRLAEKQRRDLEKEKRVLIKELLGADLVAERKKTTAEENMLEERLHFLPAEKREQLARALDKFSEREAAILERRADGTGVLNAQDNADLKKIREERETELTSLLTPEEKKLFDYWTSNAGISARHVLSGLENPTEQEFQAIYNLQKQFEEKSGRMESDGTTPPDSWQQAHDELQKKVKEALGQERYAEYERGQDMDYRNVRDALQHFQLSPELAAKFYDIKKTTVQEVNRIFSDPQLSETQKEAASNELRKQAGRTIRDLLGASAFEHYWNAGNTGWFSAE